MMEEENSWKPQEEDGEEEELDETVCGCKYIYTLGFRLIRTGF